VMVGIMENQMEFVLIVVSLQLTGKPQQGAFIVQLFVKLAVPRLVTVLARGFARELTSMSPSKLNTEGRKLTSKIQA